jgi:hypothetical protein
MTYRANNSNRLALMRVFALLLFLPAHVAFVMLIDLDFIPRAADSSAVSRSEDRARDKERLRLHLMRQSEGRSAFAEARQVVIARELGPWTLSLRIPSESCVGESVSVKLTMPVAIELWVAATPQNHRAPPA